MKIMFVPPAYFPARGGTEHMTKMMAEELARRGHDVTVLTSNLLRSEGYYTLNSETVDGPLHQYLDGVALNRVIYYRQSEIDTLGSLTRKLPNAAARLLGKAAKLVFRVRLERSIKAEIRASMPDAVVTLPHLQPNVKAAIAAAKRLNIWCGMYPLVHAHDPHWPFDAIKEAMGQVDAVFAATRVEAGEIASGYAVPDTKIHFTSLGVDIADLADGRDSVASSPSKTVLFLGRKTETKGLPVLAEACGRLAGEGRDFTMALVGSKAEDSDAMAALFRKRLSSDALVDRTNVSAEEKQQWLDDCLMLILPSALESFGMVILEAWAARRAVITLDLPVFREIVEDGVDGILVPVDDPAALAQAIATLLDDPARAAAMGRAGYTKVCAQYSWGAVCDRLELALPAA